MRSNYQDKIRIIIIDDDQLTTLLSTMILLNYDNTFIIDNFNSGKEANEYVRSIELTALTILLLDIGMPLYSGWDFLDEFTNLNSASKIFLFSSSIDKDVEKSTQYKNVIGLISKLLNAEKIERLLADAFL